MRSSQVVEEHATTVVGTAGAVVDTGMRLPKRAVRRASQGLAVASRAPQSIFSFLNGGGGGGAGSSSHSSSRM